MKEEPYYVFCKKCGNRIEIGSTENEMELKLPHKHVTLQDISNIAVDVEKQIFDYFGNLGEISTFQQVNSLVGHVENTIFKYFSSLQEIRKKIRW